MRRFRRDQFGVSEPAGAGGELPINGGIDSFIGFRIAAVGELALFIVNNHSPRGTAGLQSKAELAAFANENFIR